MPLNASDKCAGNLPSAIFGNKETMSALAVLPSFNDCPEVFGDPLGVEIVGAKSGNRVHTSPHLDAGRNVSASSRAGATLGPVTLTTTSGRHVIPRNNSTPSPAQHEKALRQIWILPTNAQFFPQPMLGPQAANHVQND
jgi:hypothetical protein